jgi:cytochrome P450
MNSVNLQAPANLDVDPFSTENLMHPHGLHELLRETAPVVWLSKYKIFGLARYAEVNAALRDWQTFSSARGSGLPIISTNSRGGRRVFFSRLTHRFTIGRAP